MLIGRPVDASMLSLGTTFLTLFELELGVERLSIIYFRIYRDSSKCEQWLVSSRKWFWKDWACCWRKAISTFCFSSTILCCAQICSISDCRSAQWKQFLLRAMESVNGAEANKTGGEESGQRRNARGKQMLGKIWQIEIGGCKQAGQRPTQTVGRMKMWSKEHVAKLARRSCRQTERRESQCRRERSQRWSGDASKWRK